MSDIFLHGARPYTDILETNPPMTIWLYTPAALLSRIFGPSADGLQLFLTFIFIAVCLGLSWNILVKARLPRIASGFLIAGSISLTLPWLSAVSEREHWALTALFPVMALQIAYGFRRTTQNRWRSIVGLLAGFAITIKPVFAICIVAPAIYTAWRTRSFKSLFQKEYGISAAVCTIYVAIVYWGYPAYRTNMLPSLLDTYFRVRAPLPALATPELVICAAMLVVFFIARGRRVLGSPVEAVSLMTGLGFLCAYILQGKGFLNHAAPVCSLVLFAILMSGMLKPSRLFHLRSITLPKAAVMATAGLVVAMGLLDLRLATNPSLYPSLAFVEPIRHLSPRPRMLAISGDLSVGHPLVREVQGQWVGSTSSQWLAASAALLRQETGASDLTRARMKQWIRMDLDRLTNDIVRGKPDVILFDENLFSEGALAREAPQLALALSAYERDGQNGSLRLLILRRN